MKDCATVLDVKTDAAAYLDTFFPFITAMVDGVVLEDDMAEPPPCVSVINTSSSDKSIGRNVVDEITVQHAVRGDYAGLRRFRLRFEPSWELGELISRCFQSHANKSIATFAFPLDRGFGARIQEREYFEEIVVRLLVAKANPDFTWDFGFNSNVLVWAANMEYTSIVDAFLQRAANEQLARNCFSRYEHTLEQVAAILPGHELVLAHLEFSKVAENLRELTLFEWAIQQNNTALIRILLEGRHHIVALDSVNDRDGSTPIIIAAASGNQDLVRELLVARANVNDVDRNGEGALFRAIENDDEGVVCALLQFKADISLGEHGILRESALLFATKRNQEGIIRALLNAKASIDAASFVHAIEQEQNELVKLMISLRTDLNAVCDGQSALCSALHNNQENSRNASPGVAAEAVLSLAKRDSSAFYMLLEARADVNVRGSGGLYPLDVAIDKGMHATVLDLIEARADVNVHTGHHALIAAITSAPSAVALAMIEARANVNAEDTQGTPALVLAIKQDMVECAKVLLHERANVNAVGIHESPLFLAREKGFTELIQTLA